VHEEKTGTLFSRKQEPQRTAWPPCPLRRASRIAPFFPFFPKNQFFLPFISNRSPLSVFFPLPPREAGLFCSFFLSGLYYPVLPPFFWVHRGMIIPPLSLGKKIEFFLRSVDGLHRLTFLLVRRRKRRLFSIFSRLLFRGVPPFFSLLCIIWPTPSRERKMCFFCSSLLDVFAIEGNVPPLPFFRFGWNFCFVK